MATEAYEYFLLESDKRLQYDSSTASAFRFQVSKALVGRYLLGGFNGYNTVYNINANNQTLVFHEGATARTVTIPQGNYTLATLSTAVGTAMSASGGGITYTVSGTTVITITAGSGNFTLNFKTNPSQTLWSKPSSTLASMLGFSNSADVTSSASAITGPNVANVNWNTHINITIDTGSGLVGSPQYPGGNANTSTYRIPTTGVAYGAFFHYEPNNDAAVQATTLAQKNLIGVTVTDDSNTTINFLNTNWDLFMSRV